MCFVSNPKDAKFVTQFGDEAAQIHEIGASLEAAIQDLGRVAGDRVRIAQMLFEPKQAWTHEVCKRAGMICVGTLDYLRMDFGLIERWPINEDPWGAGGAGIEVRQLNNLSMNTPKSDGSLLSAALESSYEGTLDCPELCGMRSMADVIASHESTGVFDPSRWWLMLKDDRPVGCCLLSHCPANESVELVYLGLSPEVQGQGFGARFLTHALQALQLAEPVHEVTCAVDRRNIPAAKVYMRLGFKRFDARCGYVCPV
jgi:ribosomal protein S18 acetylase RimI-like enzyme